MEEKQKHRPFVRVSWEEALEMLQAALQLKYKAEGEVAFKRDYGYEGVNDHYDFPHFVDVFLEKSDNPHS